MKGFVTKLAANSPVKRRNSICGGSVLLKSSGIHLSPSSIPERRLSADAGRRLSADHSISTSGGRRMSIDISSVNNLIRRASFDAPSKRRASVVYTSITEVVEWSKPIATFPREITWLAGAPGAGKGTNSSHIATARGYKAPTIVMSSLLENPECKRIKDAGGMVDDETVQRALLAELAKPEYKDGVVVDGFPRTQKQAEWLRSLHESLTISKGKEVNFNFVMLFIEEEASVARQMSRGEVIRQLNEVRSAKGMNPLEVRATDVSDVAARVRYANFIEQYDAINKLSAQFSLHVVDASAPIEVVRQRISTTLKTVSTSTTITQSSCAQQELTTSITITPPSYALL